MPERVLQFGTGMLLRAIVAAAVDAADRAGAYDGRIVVVQSTPSGAADRINGQAGLFTLVERGIRRGESIEQTRLVGAIARALVADAEWGAVRDLIVQPELRVIVSNVTEAGFRLDDDEPPLALDRLTAPRSFPAKLADLLFIRFTRLPDGPSVVVISTELVAENGPRLAAMIDQLAAAAPSAIEFRAWIARQVRFCSSLVDRITVAPSADVAAEFETRAGYRDALLTMTEPHSLWAIEGDPADLHAAFPIDGASAGAVIFAPDIARYRDRKLRMLNGAHTAIAPLALMAGVRTVREATEHRYLGRLLRQILLDEIVPSMSLPTAEAIEYAETVIDRFRNPSLDHEWRVIANNQTAKLRVRVIPSIVEFCQRRRTVPRGLALALAASLRFAGNNGEGWWSGESGPIVDVDRELIDRHWRRVGAQEAVGPVPAPVLARFADGVLGDATIWGQDLRLHAGLLEAVVRALSTIQP